MSAPEDLLERIRLRLDESFVGIGEVVADLPPADIADLVNQLTLQEAASVMSMLAVPRAIEVFDQPTLHRGAPSSSSSSPGGRPRSSKGSPPTSAPTIVRRMGERAPPAAAQASAEVRAEVERLLQYPPTPRAGS